MDKTTIATVVAALIVIMAAGAGMQKEPVEGQPIGGSTQLDIVKPISPDVLNVDTKFTVAYDSDTPIKNAIATDEAELARPLTSYEKSVNIASVTDGVLAEQVYPYEITYGTTVITVEKYLCTSEMCGYWISATRDGKEVRTNSPIWISPPPYEAVVGQTYNDVTNEVTTTVREDPKLAVELVLQQYVDRQPLGKGTSG